MDTTSLMPIVTIEGNGHLTDHIGALFTQSSVCILASYAHYQAVTNGRSSRIYILPLWVVDNLAINQTSFNSSTGLFVTNNVQLFTWDPVIETILLSTVQNITQLVTNSTCTYRVSPFSSNVVTIMGKAISRFSAMTVFNAERTSLGAAFGVNGLGHQVLILSTR